MAAYDPRGYGKNRLGAVRHGTSYGGNQSVGNYIARRLALSASRPKTVKVQVKTAIKSPAKVGVAHAVKAITPTHAGRVRWFR